MEKEKINKKDINLSGYKNLLQEVKSILQKGKNQSYKAVDNILVETRWQIGERIVREELKFRYRAEYGQYLLQNLAADLNIPKQRLSEIIRFYKCYPIIRSLSGQLSWKHYTVLISLNNHKERQTG